MPKKLGWCLTNCCQMKIRFESKKRSITQIYFKPSDNVFFQTSKNGRECWKDWVIERRIEKLFYMIKRFTWFKRHLNQRRKRHSDEWSIWHEETMRILYDVFCAPVPQIAPTNTCTSRWNRQPTEVLDLNSKSKSV